MNMQLGVLGLAALLLTVTACDTGDVDLGGPPAPPPGPPPQVSAACTEWPSVLVHVDGISRRPLEIDSADLYVVAYADTAPGDETLWRVPLSGDAPQIVAQHQDHIGGIAIDHGASSSPAPVFWSTGSAGGAGTIWRSDAGAGTAAVVTGRTAPGALIVSGERVYWAERPAGGSGQGAIEYAPSTGGNASTLQQVPGDQVPRTFDVTGDLLLWTTEDPALANETTAQIVGAPLPLPFSPLQRIAQGAAAVELAEWSVVYSGPDAIRRVIWTGTDQVSTAPMVPTSGFVQTLESDDRHLYFVDPVTRALMQAPLDADGGAAVQMLAGGVDPVTALQADGTCVYWIDAATQAIMMVRS